jgi:predicted transposase/invertase (TIGR01784 family)
MQNIPLLDPRRDVVFKTIFSKASKESSIARNSIISAFIGRKVESSTVLNPELTIEDIREKAARLDVLCVLDDGTQVNLEMQMCNTSDSIEDRLCFYCSQLYIGQESRGLPYESLKPVYVILISNQTIFDKIDKYLSLIQYRFDDGSIFSSKLNILTLELPKLGEPVTITKEMDPVQRWGLFFTSAIQEERKKILEELIETDEGINMAEKLLYEVTQNDYERAAVFEREKILTDYYAGLAYAEQKGEKQGIEQGKQEQKREIALIMKSKLISLEQISEITGLSIEEIESL